MFAGSKRVKSRSESTGESKTERWVSSQREPVKKDGVDEKERRKRELEKVENAIYLMCWGPN
ncbi:hypothetical protein DCAR_0625097 [Daucus carota subsp. sativus]|uniref:Uncharacterized protein n=1 Tax=Daucus carota subsp. sativus TaxID=79200 RepID=A0AAF1B6F5_DAUCS|nr:hypothetical protein DCAR_0625097 [Daucus carota subsp. sativus]